jgi:hypothetical protein
LGKAMTIVDCCSHHRVFFGGRADLDQVTHRCRWKSRLRYGGRCDRSTGRPTTASAILANLIPVPRFPSISESEPFHLLRQPGGGRRAGCGLGAIPRRPNS